MTFRLRDSLANRTVRRLFGVMALAVGVATTIFAVEMYSGVSERRAMLLEKIGHSMSGPISESIWMVDAPLLQRQLDAMVQIPGVAHVAVTTFIGQEFHADKSAQAGQEKYLVRRITLRHLSEPLGQLEIWGDADAVRDDVLERLGELFAIQAMLLFTTLAGAYWVFRHEVSRPLHVMAKHAEQMMARKDLALLENPLLSGAGRELKALASAIDRLQSVLHEKPVAETDAPAIGEEPGASRKGES